MGRPPASEFQTQGPILNRANVQRGMSLETHTSDAALLTIMKGRRQGETAKDTTKWIAVDPIHGRENRMRCWAVVYEWELANSRCTNTAVPKHHLMVATSSNVSFDLSSILFSFFING